uniref:ESPR domain-containing protein n=1 Tax=Acinetobacter gyllenbergii TaxID=134534 RepID=UPI003F569A70
MNKVYKVVWNASLGAWVAVSELAKTKTKTRGSVGQVVSLDLKEQQNGVVKFFNYKALSLAILTVLAPAFSFAATGDGGGATTGGAGSSNTAISPTTAQCNVTGFSQPQASVNGTNTIQSVAIGCGSIVGATNTTSQQIGDRRGGTNPLNYPSGETGYRSAGTAIGNRNSTAAGGGVALGTGNASTGEFFGVAVGQGNAADAYGVALGIGNLSNSTSAVAIGTANQATGNTAIAVGRQSYAKGDYSIALGNIATADTGATNSIAIGNTSLSTTVDSISIGRNAKSGFGGSTDVNAIAIGADSTSYAYGVALGNGATADQSGFTSTNGGVAIGSAASTEANTLSGIAIGNSAKVSGSATNSTAIGKDANASVNNSVALGAGSTTTAQSGNSLLTNVAASATNGVVSVGTASATRRIQNVADGSAASDAVTVAQLDKAYDDAHNNLKNVLGGNATYNAGTNTYTAPTNIGGTGKTTIDDAIKAVKTTVTAGSNIVVTPTTAADGSTTYSVATSATPTFTSVTANNVTVNNAPTSGTDATNKTYVDGKVQTLANTPLGFVGDSGTKATRKLGEDLNVKGGATGTLTNGNIGVVSNGSNQLDIKLAETVNLGTNGSVTTGNTVINNAGVTADKVTVGGVIIDKTTGINAGGKAITNVAAGTATTDAVNKGQLDTVSTQANKAITFTGNARKSGDTTDVDRKLGESIAISGVASTAGTFSGANVKTVTDQTGSIAIQIADAPNFAGTVTSTGQQVNGNSVVTGTSTIGSGANAVTLSGTANGLDVGNKKITNVAAPTVGSDATNKTYVDGKVQTLADTPLGFVGDSGTKATRKLGEDLNVKGGATGTLTNGNIGVVSNGSNQLDIKLAETVNLGTNGSVTTGNTKIDNSGLTITGGPSVTNTGINAANKNISNVADATTADQAVNKGQLDAATTAADTKTDNLGNSTANNLGGGSTYDNT